MTELEALDNKQSQAGADPVTPIVEQSPVTNPIGPTMEEPLAARPTSPRGGVHDEGVSADMLGYEEAWTAVEMLADPAGVGTETEGNSPSSTAHDLPVVAEQAMPTAAPVMGMGLERPV